MALFFFRGINIATGAICCGGYEHVVSSALLFQGGRRKRALCLLAALTGDLFLHSEKMTVLQIYLKKGSPVCHSQ